MFACFYTVVLSILVAVKGQYKTECGLIPADFVFLLDSSGSEKASGFKKQVDFISNFTSNFDIGPNKTRFAAVTFSTSVFNNFYLKQYTNKTSLMAAINNINFRDGETYTNLGLDHVRTKSLSAVNGARPGIAKYVIVLTDGRSNEEARTLSSAQALHKVPNVTVIAIGIGQGIDMGELNAIATDKNHTFVVNTFDLLGSLQKELTDKTCTLCGNYPADIAFLVDSSGSEYGSNFQNEKDFVSLVSSEFTYSANDTQIAVSQFSNSGVTEIRFGQYATQAALLQAIQSIHWLNGETNTAAGLRNLQSVFQLKHHSHAHHGHHGHHAVLGSRDNSVKIAVVLTDGRSNEPDQTIKAAQILHRLGIEVFAVGIGRHVDPVELNGIASDRNHVLFVQSTNQLVDIHNRIVGGICELKHPPPTTTPKTTPTTTTTTTTMPSTTVKQACGQKPADVVFVLDASESEKIEGFQQEKDFVYNFAKRFHIGPQNVQFSAVTFSTDVKNNFYLNTYHHRNDLLNAIRNIAYMNAGTNTSEALKYVREHSFQVQNGARPNATHIAIVITDGKSADPALTKHEADLLHKQHVQVYAVGVGNEVDQTELNAIASDRHGTFLFRAITSVWQMDLKMPFRWYRRRRFRKPKRPQKNAAQTTTFWQTTSAPETDAHSTFQQTPTTSHLEQSSFPYTSTTKYTTQKWSSTFRQTTMPLKILELTSSFHQMTSTSPRLLSPTSTVKKTTNMQSSIMSSEVAAFQDTTQSKLFTLPAMFGTSVHVTMAILNNANIQSATSDEETLCMKRDDTFSCDHGCCGEHNDQYCCSFEGLIIGIVIGVALLVAVIAGIAFCCVKKVCRRKDVGANHRQANYNCRRTNVTLLHRSDTMTITRGTTANNCIPPAYSTSYSQSVPPPYSLEAPRDHKRFPPPYSELPPPYSSIKPMPRTRLHSIGDYGLYSRSTIKELPPVS